MIPAALLLLAVGSIPLPEVVKRFPDSSFYSGSGPQRDAAMLEAIAEEAGEELLTRGPGPGQIMARFHRGELSPEERVAVLLTSCHYHDLQLLPLYQWAFEKGEPREKVAALVGFYQLVGLDPPAPSQIPAKGELWQALAQRVGELAQEARQRALVPIWVRSFLAASGLAQVQGFVFRATPQECLRALLRLAAPEDLGEVLALWPLVSKSHRSILVRLLENLTLARWVPPPPNPEGPTGPWIMETAEASVDAWVARMCKTPDGWATFWQRAAQLGNGDVPQGLLLVLRQPYPPAWPQAVWHLQLWGAPAVILERSRMDHPVNQGKVKKLRTLFSPGTRQAESEPPQVFPFPGLAAPEKLPPSRPVPPRVFPGQRR